MERIIRSKILLINCLFFLFVSCDTKRYIINWNSFDINTDDLITITFWDTSSSKLFEYNLIPNKTKEITVLNSSKYIGYEVPVEFKLVIYPIPDNLPKGGYLEVFLFNPTIEKINENEYILKKQENVEAYFIKFFRNGKRYYSVSKDEIITIQKEIIPNSIEQLLEMILIEDITYYDEAGTNNYHGAEISWGGYIVKAKTDDKYLWLNSSLPIIP